MEGDGRQPWGYTVPNDAFQPQPFGVYVEPRQAHDGVDLAGRLSILAALLDADDEVPAVRVAERDDRL